MAIAIITGSAGLIGSEAVNYFCELGFEVVGIDNDMRQTFFGPEASTSWNRNVLQHRFPRRYHHENVDIRDQETIKQLFKKYGSNIKLIIHTAAQPSHDWAAHDPLTDFTVNANGTLVLLEVTRQFCSDAVFIYTSTNKVYGDTPNRLPLTERETRWEIEETHPFFIGIDESMNIDASKHSLFGASKLAADILVQEYGRYFEMKTTIFRGGCLTGPNHSGTALHGFLAYLMKCICTSKPYIVYGYKGKQVRDNIHSADLVAAFYHVFNTPRLGEVYNIGGSRYSNCSMMEAISLGEEISDKKLNWSYTETNRSGDHIWYISDIRKFQAHYPKWRQQYNLRQLLEDIYHKNIGRWTAAEK